MSDERCLNCGCRIHAADYRIGVCDCDCQSHTIAALRAEVERLKDSATRLENNWREVVVANEQLADENERLEADAALAAAAADLRGDGANR